MPTFLGLFGASLFKDVDELAISPRDLVHGGIARGFFRPPSDERFPEVSAPDSKANEAGHASCNCQPFAHLLVVLSAAQDDAANFVPASVPSSRHDAFAILPPIKTFDLPDVGFDVRVLQLLDGLDHKPGANFQVISLFVALDLFQLRLLCRNQQLKHEKTSTLAMQVIGQALEAVRLPPVEGLVALRVVSHEHFAECRLKGLDVGGKVFAVLEIELILSALLDRTSDSKPVRLGVVQYGCPELLVHQDSCTLFRHPGGNRRLETVVDHAFCLSDLRRLFRGKRALPTEHARLERAAMVERQDVQWPFKCVRHREASLSLR